MKKNILIIGGCGFIGHNLAVYLKSKNYRINVVDNFKVNNLKSLAFEHKDKSKIKIYKNFLNERIKILKNNNIKIFRIDAKNIIEVKKLCLKIKPDFIIHLAAVSHADRSNKTPNRTFENSVITLKNILEVSKNLKSH